MCFQSCDHCGAATIVREKNVPSLFGLLNKTDYRKPTITLLYLLLLHLLYPDMKASRVSLLAHHRWHAFPMTIDSKWWCFVTLGPWSFRRSFIRRAGLGNGKGNLSRRTSMSTSLRCSQHFANGWWLGTSCLKRTWFINHMWVNLRSKIGRCSIVEPVAHLHLQ